MSVNPPLHPAIAPIIIDIEASGFGAGSYPIEIGLALPDGDSYCSLVQPEPEWTHWSASAEAVHHIPRAILFQQGHPARQIAAELNERLAGKVVYSDGWSNDYSWLALLFDAAGSVPRFRLDSLRTLLTEDEAAQWHATKGQIQAELHPVRHRASNDARVLQLTVLRVKQKHPPAEQRARQHEMKLIDEMVELDALTLGDVISTLYGHCDRAMLRERHAKALSGGARVIAEHFEHRLAGYVLLRAAGDGESEMLSFNLHPWYRRTGLYRRLLMRTLAHLLAHGVHTLSSVVLPGHSASIRFHERLGFALERSKPLALRYTIRVSDLARRLRQS